MNETKIRVATFCIQGVTLIILLIHLLAAWQYKAKWQDLNARIEKLEAAHTK